MGSSSFRTTKFNDPARHGWGNSRVPYEAGLADKSRTFRVVAVGDAIRCERRHSRAAGPTNSRFEESFPAWLQSVLPFDGDAAGSVAAAQQTEQPTENNLFHQPTPVRQSDWSTLPIPSAQAATFLPLPMLGPPDKDDPWLATSHPNLELNLSPMQPIPDFLKGSRGVPLTPPTLLSEFPTPRPSEHNAWRSHPLFEADRRPLGTSAWSDDYQSAPDPLRVTISQNQWEASSSTNLSPSQRAANSQGVPDISSIQQSLSNADPPTWTPAARYAQNTPRRGAPGLKREPSSEESIRLLLYHHARRLLGEMIPEILNCDQ